MPLGRVVRAGEPKDIAEIVAIDHAAFPQSHGHEGEAVELDDEKILELRRARFEEELRSHTAKLWVIEADGQILAYLNAWLAPGEVHLLHVATREDRRREGLGRVLVMHLLELAQGIDAIVVLEVRKGNEAAKRLYETLGFEVSRVRKAYYPDGEDAIEFVWRRQG